MFIYLFSKYSHCLSQYLVSYKISHVYICCCKCCSICIVFIVFLVYLIYDYVSI